MDRRTSVAKIVSKVVKTLEKEEIRANYPLVLAEKIGDKEFAEKYKSYRRLARGSKVEDCYISITRDGIVRVAAVDRKIEERVKELLRKYGLRVV